MSDCPQSWLLSAFTDGELSAEGSERLSTHLEICSGCKQELDHLEALHSTLVSLPSDGSARARILQEITTSTEPRLLSSHHVRIPWPLAASILLVFALSVVANAYFLFLSDDDGTTGRDAQSTTSVSSNPVNQESSTKAQAPESWSSSKGSTPSASVHAKGNVRSKKVRLNTVRLDPKGQAGVRIPSSSPQISVVINSQDSDSPIYRISSDKSYRLNELPIIRVGGIVSPQD